MNIKQSILMLFALILLFVFNDSAMAQKTCCTRFISSMPVSGADNKSQSDILIGYWEEVLIVDAIVSECPNIDIVRMGKLEHLDYVFKSNFSDNKQRGICTLNLQLYDHHHGKVVKEAQAMWKYDETAGSMYQHAVQPIHDMAKQFMPLSKTLSDYERVPESCSVDPEKDPVEPDETIAVNISGIKDSEGRTSADFQWILVDAKKGEIVNGDEWNGYKGFQVGGGAVNVEYKAPKGCKKEEETVFVYNSCWQKPEHPGLPENKIGDTTFSIEPKVIEAFIEFDHEVGFIKYAPDGVKIRVTENIKGMVPITIHLKDKPPSIKGKGTVASKDYGSRGGCTISGSNKVTVAIAGVVKETKNKEIQLLINYGGKAPPHELRTVCGDKTFSVLNPNMAIGNDGEFIGDFTFLLEDGFRIHIPYGTGRGWNYILNVPCQRGSK